MTFSARRRALVALSPLRNCPLWKGIGIGHTGLEVQGSCSSLSAWVFREACKKARRRLEGPPSIHLSNEFQKEVTSTVLASAPGTFRALAESAAPTTAGKLCFNAAGNSLCSFLSSSALPLATGPRPLFAVPLKVRAGEEELGKGPVQGSGPTC